MVSQKTISKVMSELAKKNNVKRREAGTLGRHMQKMREARWAKKRLTSPSCEDKI